MFHWSPKQSKAQYGSLLDGQRHVVDTTEVQSKVIFRKALEGQLRSGLGKTVGAAAAAYALPLSKAATCLLTP